MRTTLAFAAMYVSGAFLPGSAATLPTGNDGHYRETADSAIVATTNNEDRLPLDAGSSNGGASAVTPLAHLPRISSGFGLRSDPMGMGVRMHRGIDLPSAAGTAVRAVMSGTVRYAGWAGGYGNLVEIDHGNGIVTRYGHLSRVDVAPGEAIGEGTHIGRVGSTGRSTGAHLHYEIRIGGRAVNPAQSRSFGRSRLFGSSPWLPPETLAKARWRGWSDPAKTGQLPVPESN